MNELNLRLYDNEYPKSDCSNIRNISRAVLLNENNEVCLLTIKRDDEFGHHEYKELPGGGIDNNETMEDAIIRELEEEVGVISSIITKIGTVIDEYNLLNRTNINNYFLCKIDSYKSIHHKSKGDELIESLSFHNIDEVINLFNNNLDYEIPKLVKDRELPVLKWAKEYIKFNL